jgi:geranylgeranyl reductase family protein
VKLPLGITILGAGPAGCTAALFLAQAGIASTLIERAPSYPRDKICGDALSGKVVDILRRLDPALVPALAAEPTSLGSFGIRFVAPNGRDVVLPFKENATTPPGYISQRLDFDAFLFEQVQRQPLISVQLGRTLKTVVRADEGFELSFADGVNERAGILLAADGAQSPIARQLHGHKVESRHHCAGLRGYYHGVEGLQERGVIELHFLKETLPGYLWVFPIADRDGRVRRANVGLGIRTDHVSRRKLDLRKLLTELLRTNPELGPRFAHAELEGPIQGFGLPLGSQRRPISGAGYLLLGDAGALIDPFTGEGISNAMVSGLVAARAVIASRDSGQTDARFFAEHYDAEVYKKLWSELRLSRILQELVGVPGLFNFVVNRAAKSPTLQQTLTSMFDNIDMRAKLRDPMFYLKLLVA